MKNINKRLIIVVIEFPYTMALGYGVRFTRWTKENKNKKLLRTPNNSRGAFTARFSSIYTYRTQRVLDAANAFY